MSGREQILHRIGFLEGAIEGITLYAIWRNGEQLVGCIEKPLKEVLKPYKEELARLADAGGPGVVEHRVVAPEGWTSTAGGDKGFWHTTEDMKRFLLAQDGGLDEWQVEIRVLPGDHRSVVSVQEWREKHELEEIQ